MCVIPHSETSCRPLEVKQASQNTEEFSSVGYRRDLILWMGILRLSMTSTDKIKHERLLKSTCI